MGAAAFFIHIVTPAALRPPSLPSFAPSLRHAIDTNPGGDAVFRAPERRPGVRHP
ncbi:hypothetical protein HMPREF9440_01108 [Sutterella parvirubra YIT 11816]|uniref:Uncharacterized protein n=1 Tax=Sutterella parvirubra YIT 11816 TaxID=762967 RepID=H3KEE4_9BURK|nr:hypothetical protein HMPREF9440_01108 [Sutterella parvirubra YIT 11816]